MLHPSLGLRWVLDKSLPVLLPVTGPGQCSGKHDCGALGREGAGQPAEHVSHEC